MCLGVCVRPVKVKVGFSSKLNFFFLTLSLPASSENDKKIFISDDRDQCDQIGRYLKVLGDKISNKSSPNDWQLFGQFENLSLVQILLVLLFGQLLETFGVLFTPTSGHTDRDVTLEEIPT